MFNFIEILAGAAAFSSVVAAGSPAGYGAPTYEAEKPHYEGDKPSYGGEKPAYGAEKPSYEAEKHHYEAVKPSYEAEKPYYQAEKPSYEAEKPHYEAEKPEYYPTKSAYHEAPKYGQGYPSKPYYPTTIITTTYPATTTTVTISTSTSTTSTTSTSTTTTTSPIVQPTPNIIYISNIVTDAVTVDGLLAIGDVAFVAQDGDLAQDLLAFGSPLTTQPDNFFTTPNPETGDGFALFDASTQQYAVANLANPYPTTTEGATAYYIFFNDVANAVGGDDIFIDVATTGEGEPLLLTLSYTVPEGGLGLGLLHVCPGNSLDEVLVIALETLDECTEIELSYVASAGQD
ncbi:hypothetical protein CERZMDRAFT_84513 [Cercospora zeae-maydis SCOH1-5]|uniref:Uncharacterized protein n=1 Tax=Cercospora zeae-maydis SCOH1-5 TaxID=717836 RepID=A0A6A6FHQ3_9PEZI|nr:hypothetical protein CERZMDRAFT_84513 [Cercospora zeae-maydis SCOH1-5]